MNRTVANAGIALLALGIGCATSNASHKMENLRDSGGACADVNVGLPPLLWTNVKACAQTGSPFTTSDSNIPKLITILDGETFEDADPGNWLITVTAPNGTVVLNGQPAHSVPTVGICNSSGCRKDGFGVSYISAPWGPGTYHVHYVLTYNTRRFADLTITLEGTAPANSGWGGAPNAVTNPPVPVRLS